MEKISEAKKGKYISYFSEKCEKKVGLFMALYS